MGFANNHIWTAARSTHLSNERRKEEKGEERDDERISEALLNMKSKAA